MPQMAPLNWMILFIYFLILMLMMNNFLYFYFIYNNLNFKNQIKKKNIFWKW
uniref:ATP synthase complex subunit 8 n=1 Tax=Discolomatinae sp. GENSP01 TaxID=1205622 RepID=A0A0S2MNT0_9CUCU|nr:ATP synthase F0 subunit 8 [Discolomatinae sp. GENSP01]